MIRRITSKEPQKCHYCRSLSQPGELLWMDDRSGAIGCCRRCCDDASKAIVQQHQTRVLIHGMSHTYAFCAGE